MAGGIGKPATGLSPAAQKAKDIAGIKARSIKKYGAGKMQRQANLEATYARTHPAKPTKAPRPTTQPNGKPASSRPKPDPTSPPRGNPAPGTKPTVYPLRGPGPRQLPKPSFVPGRPAGSRPKPDPTSPPRGNPGPGAKPFVMPLRGPNPRSPGQLQGNGSGPPVPKGIPAWGKGPFAPRGGTAAKPIVGKVK